MLQIAILSLGACHKATPSNFVTQCILNSDCIKPDICVDHICGLHEQAFWAPCVSDSDCEQGFLCDIVDNVSNSAICTSGNNVFDLPKAALPTTGKKPSAVAVGDFNNDGNPDIAAANSGEYTVSIFLGSGGGNFSSPQVINSDPDSISNPQFLATGDFDHNGFLDLAVVNAANSKISILSNSQGNFSAPTQSFYSQLYSYPLSIAVGDIDQDGNLDIIAANSNSSNNLQNPNSGSATALLGNGDGTFQSTTAKPLKQIPTAPFATGAKPLSVALNDFDGDGKLDFATADNLDNTVSVLLGHGDGTFDSKTVFSVDPDPVSLCSGDFNGDGSIDIATANRSAGTVSVLLNKGDKKGSFHTAKSYSAGSHPGSIMTGRLKFNALSLIVTNSDTSAVSILFGNKDGTFQALTPYSMGATFAPASSAMADFDNNGSLDIVATNPENNNIEFLFSSQRIECTAHSDCGRVTWGDTCPDNNLCACSSDSSQAGCLNDTPYCHKTNGCTCGTQQCVTTQSNPSHCLGKQITNAAYLTCAKGSNCTQENRGYLDEHGYSCSCSGRGFSGGALENNLCNSSYPQCITAELDTFGQSFALCQPSYTYCLLNDTYAPTDPCCTYASFMQNNLFPYGCACQNDNDCYASNCVAGACAPVSACTAFTDSNDCTTNGDFCYWDSSSEACGACLALGTCTYTTASGCQGCGCYWHDSKCATCPSSCGAINSEANCSICQCTWHNYNGGFCS